MYEQVKKHLVQAGFKKTNTSILISVRDDMLFAVAPDGIKNNINVWYSIYPLALPDIPIRRGWFLAAGSFPKSDGKETNIPYEPEKVEEAMILEIEQNIFPLFAKCSSLSELECLYGQGNFRSRYPQAFALLAMKKYSEGQWMLHELTEAFENECWGLREQEIVWKYVRFQTFEEIETALQAERANNIKKYKLANYIKTTNKANSTDAQNARN